MSDLIKQKCYVEKDGSTAVVCSLCQGVKTVHVLEFRQRRHLLKVKCSCGHHFPIELEFRRHHRKPTSLPGSYEAKTTLAKRGRLLILNLSLHGACFEVKGKHHFKPGDRGSLAFTLDDEKETVVSKNMVVRNVNGNRVGCEFIDDRAYDKALGFYLFL